MKIDTTDISNSIIDERDKKKLLEFLNKTCIRLTSISVEDFENKHIKKNNSVTFTAPESICSGYSGIIILMIEAYHNGMISLEKIEIMVDHLVNYCRKNPSQDYSLYTGRSGVIYTLIQLFEITNNDHYLSHCLELIRSADLKEFINSSYTSDYIFNGRAGTLLTLVNLYLVTKDQNLPEYISLIYLKLLNNCEVSENGISWKECEEINIENSVGFAFGASGIKYSLQVIHTISENSGINYIIKNINHYINSHWDNQQNSFKNFEKEIVNREVFSEYLDQYLEKKSVLTVPTFKKGWSQGLLGNILPWSENQGYDLSQLRIKNFENTSLFDGNSGLGLFYLKQNETIHSYNIYLKELTKNFIEDYKPDDISGGLLFGELSKAYFLLKVLNNNIGSKNILEPFIEVSTKINDLYFNDLVEVRKIILSHFFKRTLDFLQEYLPRILGKYFSTEIKNIPETISFIEFIKNLIKNFKGTKTAEQLEDIYLLEKKRYNIKISDKECNIIKYFESFLHKRNSLNFLDHDDSWFLKQSAEISKNVYINQSKWNWTYASDKKFLNENLQKDADNCEYIIMLNEKNELIEYYLGLESIILKTFNHPIQIETAISDLKSYLLSQPYENLFIFSRQSGSKDMDDFLERLDFLLIQRIRYFIFSGILNKI
ncbi:lanthionine synthetase LanC family protein [Chryseobacterium gambrini]|uniref:lanthionine synthetase LanC family protein n=1 Tax=Chryseobacterium gambrini TaxID=373672 RepID=UPI003BA61BDE